MTHYNLKALLKMVLGNFTESTIDGVTVYSGDDDCRTTCCLIESVIKAVDRSDSVQRFLFKSGVEWPTAVDETSKGKNLKDAATEKTRLEYIERILDWISTMPSPS